MTHFPASIDTAKLKISVITAVRNGKPYLEQTIKSVINQDYPNVEYIVIDGASTDGTLDVVRSYASAITKWISEKDEGIADAFNKGLALTTGDYILILNADDALADSSILSEVACAITEAGFPELIYGDFNILDRSSGQKKGVGTVQLSSNGIVYGQVLPHPCLFTRRSYFEKYGVFDKNYRIAMDYEWLIRGVLSERVVHVPRIITNIRDGGISTQHREYVVEEIIAALRKNGFIASKWKERKTRAYFYLRARIKKLLLALRVYDLLRSKQ